MIWIGVDIALAVIGLAVLAGLAVRLWRQVRQLGRDVAAAGERISAASDQLNRIPPRG
ncbi:MAG TPA: hypothetical protein VG708_12535 [Mycobacteriales bacterium]|nr:hypothetical protein [Mycobacteriales bacterium]